MLLDELELVNVLPTVTLLNGTQTASVRRSLLRPQSVSVTYRIQPGDNGPIIYRVITDLYDASFTHAPLIAGIVWCIGSAHLPHFRHPSVAKVKLFGITRYHSSNH